MLTNLKYTLGIDVGVSSIGWAIVKEEEGRKRLIDLGIRIFDAAEHPKDGSSLALPRRQARSVRRRLRRRRGRLDSVRSLIIKHNILTNEELERLYDKSFSKNPFELRCEALERILDSEEFARILIHVAKRRGYKSNRKADEQKTDADAKKVLSAIQVNQNLMQEKGYRTVAEMINNECPGRERKRNTTGDYRWVVTRGDLENEIKVIFQYQSDFGNLFCTPELEADYLAAFNYQLSYDSNDVIKKMIGMCQFEEEELRAPKKSFTFEWFRLLSTINNLKVINANISRELTKAEKQAICQLALDKSEVKYQAIRKALQLDTEDTFNMLANTADTQEPEKSVFVKLLGYHSLRNAIEKNCGKDAWRSIKDKSELLDTIAEALTYYKTDENILKYLGEKNAPSDIANASLTVTGFNKTGHLSLKALKKIIPYLEEGLKYNEACQKAGYDFQGNTGEKQKLLPEIPAQEIRNPVVIRALSQSRKVINTIIRRYGSPYYINVEVARELYNDLNERRTIQKNQLENRQKKERIAASIQEERQIIPSAEDILKYRFYEEQHGKCMYSLNAIDRDRLFEDGYVQIDHIIPYSRCFDDGMNNKCLVLSRENQHKQNKIPYEYFGHDDERWASFDGFVKSCKNLSPAKRSRLLKREFGENDEKQWKERHLNDTRYIARFLKNYLENNLLLAEGKDKQRVRCIPGELTAFLRAKWGLFKVREDNDRHHALDAIVITCANQVMLQRIAEYSRQGRLYNQKIGQGRFVDANTGEITTQQYNFKDKWGMSIPWPNFRSDVLTRVFTDLLPHEEFTSMLVGYTDEELQEVRPLFVSRAPYRKTRGKAHKETIYSGKLLEKEECVSVKTPITSVKLKDLEMMVGKETDQATYQVLRQRLEEFDDNPQKAFASPVYKPTKNGQQGPEIKSIKIKEKLNSYTQVNSGIAKNDRMVRVDVFYKNNKYYFVPVYVADIYSKSHELPSLAIKANKPKQEWDVIDDTYEFRFSLYPNDLIHLKTKTEDIFGYYVSASSSTGALNILSHDRDKTIGKEGIKQSVGAKEGVLLFEKYVVDPLGYYYPVQKEKRVGIIRKDQKEGSLCHGAV